MKRRLPLLVVALALVLTGCARANTPASEMQVHIAGYNFIPTAPKTLGCVAPQSSQWLGSGDSGHSYPAGVRQFTFGKSTDKHHTDYEPLPLTTNDSATIGLVGYVTFRLVGPRVGDSKAAQDKACETLKRFHNELGSKIWNGHPGYVDGEHYEGWDAMLDQVLGAAATAVVSGLGGAHSALETYTDAAVRDEIEAKIGEELPAQVTKASGGGNYFEIIDVTLGKPEPSDKYVSALNDASVVEQENLNATKRNATAKTKFAQITECKSEGISEANCVLLYGINTGNVPLLQAGTGVAVTK